MQVTDGEEHVSGRGRRAVALIAVALVAIVVAGAAFLRPELSGLARNAGLTALPSPTPEPPLLSNKYFATYDFVTTSLGWALVSEQTETPRFWVFMTADGARHWHVQLAGTAPVVPNGSFKLRFFDDDHGLITLSDPLVIYSTTDRGAHWTPVKVPPYVLASADFSDPQHGWIFGFTGTTQSLVSQLSYTADGGGSWSVLPQVPNYPIGGKEGTFSANFVFRGPTEGWLGGAAAAPGRSVLYSSIDAGVTWQPHPLPVDLRADQPNPKEFAAEISVYLIPGAGVIAQTTDDQGRIVGFTSFDGGSSWRRLSPPPGETTFADFVFQDTFHWWAMRYGTLFKSSDAGQSWTEVAQEMDEWDYLPGIIDAKHAWAQMQVVFPSTSPPQGSGLAMSSDGGVHWTPVNVPRPV